MVQVNIDPRSGHRGSSSLLLLENDLFFLGLTTGKGSCSPTLFTVSTRREGVTYIGSFTVKNDRSALLFLAHQAGILEMIHQSHFSLYSCISEFADLFTIELFPFSVVELIMEGDDVLGTDKIDEGIAHVALVLRQKSET